MDITVSEAQADMRRGYCSGASGILASALAWICAVATVIFVSPQRAIWVLLIGGVFIHPASLLICRLLGARGSHTKGNPFGALAFASTIWLVFCCLIALALGLLHVQWFFLAMLLIIGGRYMVFSSIFGMQLYWCLGGALGAAGLLYSWAVWSMHAVPIVVVVATGALIEVLFAVVCFMLHFRWARSNNSSKRTREKPRAA